MTEAEQQKVNTNEKEKKEHPEDDTDSDDGEHDHDHEHGHDHDHEKKGEDGKKQNRGEKKFKKAMTKLGLKQVTGINRVTIKKGKNLLLYIDEPEVFKSPGVENSYIIFGEPKMNDFSQNLAANEANKFMEPTQQQQQQQKVAEVEKKVEEASEASTEDVSEVGISTDSIKMVMEHCNCDRKKAVLALKETNGDAVSAILKISG